MGMTVFSACISAVSSLYAVALPASWVRAWVPLNALTELKLAVMLHWFWKPLRQHREGDGQTGSIEGDSRSPKGRK